VHPSFYVRYSEDLIDELAPLLGSRNYMAWRVADKLKYAGNEPEVALA